MGEGGSQRSRKEQLDPEVHKGEQTSEGEWSGQWLTSLYLRLPATCSVSSHAERARRKGRKQRKPQHSYSNELKVAETIGTRCAEEERAILDLATLKVYFAGHGDYDLTKELPPGTECFQGELAPSGHMVLPCCEFMQA